MVRVPRFLQLCYVEVGTSTLGRGVNEPLGKPGIARAVGITYALLFDFVSGVPEDKVKQYIKWLYRMDQIKRSL